MLVRNESAATSGAEALRIFPVAFALRLIHKLKAINRKRFCKFDLYDFYYHGNW